MPVKSKRLSLVAGLACTAIGLSACDGTAPYTGGSVYYDSMLWNDYYYGYDRPRPPIDPDLPARPVNPIEPPKPVRPPRPVDPGFSRPPRPSVPMHRPSPRGGGRGLR